MIGAKQMIVARNRAIEYLSRKERRRLLAEETRRRTIGDWGPWEEIYLPNGVPGGGWCRDIISAHRNKVFCVLKRPTSGAVHFGVSSFSQIRPTWHEMQRIKNDLAGKEKTAVEVYPPHSQMVDGANMFHIFVLDASVPFSIWSPDT